jgi:hypothetical protein
MIDSRKFILVILLGGCLASAQTVTSFPGIDASQVASPELDVDPNGAVGTKQFMEWVNPYFQAYDKVTFAPIWAAPQIGTQPWRENKMTDCYGIFGDGIVLFDRLASRWVIGGHTNGYGGNYFYCVAISNTDDLSSNLLSWYTYEFLLNPVITNANGKVYYPDWPRLGTWANGYYVTFDLLDTAKGYLPAGVLACALDRTDMLLNYTAQPMQCFSDPSPLPTSFSMYLMHSLIPADIAGSTPPPAGRDEYLVSIQNPPNDQHTTASNSINLWDFHVDWANPVNSTFSRSSVTVPAYNPGCYNVLHPARTACVPEPTTGVTHNRIDSVGDRLMPNFAYRNFGSYESFLVSHTVQTGVNGNTQTGIRWYELRGSGAPSLYQSGTINAGGKYLYRFVPSIAQDNVGNAGVGYNTSSVALHPGIKASWWNLRSNSKPAELSIVQGGGDEENSPHWGDYTSMTVDPVDNCTFWYVSEYFAADQIGSIDWNTRIANFKISSCH